jgi:hypothetical protein
MPPTLTPENYSAILWVYELQVVNSAADARGSFVSGIKSYTGSVSSLARALPDLSDG